MRKIVKNLVVGGIFLGIGAYIYRMVRTEKVSKDTDIIGYNYSNRKYLDLTELCKDMEEQVKDLNEEVKELKEEQKVLKKEAC